MEHTLTAPSFTIEPRGSLVCGPGVIAGLPDLVRSLAWRRVFLVADPGVSGAGVTARLADLLRQNGVEVGVFDQIRPNPTASELEAGAEVIRVFGGATVVAVGGGAVLDVAKGLALMAVNPGSAHDFAYPHDPEHAGLPVIAVPTTAGTGSETNGWGVIDDPTANRKFYVGHASVQPRFAVLDPELAVGVPPGPTAAAGVDALAHAVESLSSVRANPYADALNLEVVRTVFRWLPACVAGGQDLEARGRMLVAAHLAGLAFGTTGLGLGHALAHALSARIHAPHGVVLSVVLPQELAFNLPVCGEIYAQLGDMIGAAGDSPRESDYAQAFIGQVRRLSAGVGLPATLGDLGLTSELIPTIAADALADEVLLNTPRRPSSQEMIELLHGAM